MGHINFGSTLIYWGGNHKKIITALLYASKKYLREVNAVKTKYMLDLRFSRR
jgi:hypothetical protein